MTTTNTTPRIYPGLNCSAIEFFNQDNQVKAFTKGKMVDFEDLPYSYHQQIQDARKKLPEAQAILDEWFPNSDLQQNEKFVSCRFGGLDYTPDIQNFQLQDGEYWDCPLRGVCKGEGKVCKNLTYNGHEFSAKEIKLIKLLITNLTNEVLYEEMNMCQGTFHVFKKDLYAKLGNIQTKQEVAVIASNLNLI